MASLEPSAEWSTCEAPPARHPAVSSSSARTSRISSRPGKKTSTAPLPVRESDALAPCSWRARPAVPICAMRLTTAAAKRQSALSVSAALDVDAPVGAPLSAGADCEHGSVSVPHANPPASTYPESRRRLLRTILRALHLSRQPTDDCVQGRRESSLGVVVGRHRHRRVRTRRCLRNHTPSERTGRGFVLRGHERLVKPGLILDEFIEEELAHGVPAVHLVGKRQDRLRRQTKVRRPQRSVESRGHEDDLPVGVDRSTWCGR
eukprot:scaffold79282_cov29-Tisochrysis_lutea.AAC.5